MKGISTVAIVVAIISLALGMTFLYKTVSAPEDNSTISKSSKDNTNTFPLIEPETKPTGDLPQDIWSWLTKAPWGDVIDFLFSGLFGIVQWFSQLINILFNPIMQLILRNPAYVLPWWFGILFVVILMTLLLVTQWENLWGLGYAVIRYALILLFFILGTAAVLIFLGVI